MKALKIIGRVGRAATIAGAWLSAGLSVGILVLFLIVTSWGDPRDVSAFFMSTANGITRSAWGLSYHAYGGCVLAIFEATLLVVAMWISTRSGDWLRRIGLTLLVGWAVLLLVGGFWVFPEGDPAVFTIPVFLAAVGRAVLGWTHQRSSGGDDFQISHDGLA